MTRSLIKQATQGFSWRFGRYSKIYRAFFYRYFLRDVQFVAITGTAGKTTVKDLSASILSQFGPTVSTNDSANDPSAVAKVVLATHRNDLFSVIEVSGAKPGLLTWPIRLVRPNISVITLIQKEHARAGYTIDDIANEKTKLVKALPPDGVAVLNIDDPYLAALENSLSCRVVWVGTSKKATIRLTRATSAWPEPLTLTIEYGGTPYEVTTQLHGAHLAIPVLSSLGVAVASQHSLNEALSALQSIQPSEGRMQPVEVGGATFVRDDWKAPLWSLDAPLLFMRNAQASRKIIIIGTVSDYSLSASKLYPKLAKRALECADVVVFVGPQALRAAKKSTNKEQGRLKTFIDVKSAASYLKQELQQGDLVLLKGSNRADHLVRLMYHMVSPIECWRTRCGKSQFCGSCDLLYKKYSQIAATVSSQTTGEDLFSLCAGNTPELILVGLGNSGSKFQYTRHNAGALMLNQLASEHGLTWCETEAGSACWLSASGRPILLFKPKGAINHTGAALAHLLNGSGVSINNCVLIHDDIDLTLGDVRRKLEGGDGGHLGVRSVLEEFDTGDFARLRIGVRADGDSRPARLMATEQMSDKELELLAAGLDKLQALIPFFDPA